MVCDFWCELYLQLEQAAASTAVLLDSVDSLESSSFVETIWQKRSAILRRIGYGRAAAIRCEPMTDVDPCEHRAQPIEYSKAFVGRASTKCGWPHLN